MSEHLSNPEQGELLTLRNVIEGMSPSDILEYKARMLSEISDRETLVNLINDVLDGYGIQEVIG